MNYKGEKKTNMMNKNINILLLSIFFLSLVSATSIGTFKQGDDVRLYQTCNNCTYCNFTSISDSDGIELLNNIEATKDGTYYSYNLLGGNITKIGSYTYCYDCGNSGESTTGCLTFNSTPSGFQDRTGFYFLLIVLSIGVIILGYYVQDAWVVVLGSFAMVLLGLYILFYGIDGIRDVTYTWGIGLIVLAIGSYFGIKGTMEKLDG